MESTELSHYGVKGMKWGIRRYQNKNGTLTDAGKKRYYQRDFVIKKGTISRRVALSRSDTVSDNKKYVSVTPADHKKWESYLGKLYLRRNKITYNHTYVATKNLKVMSTAKQGKLYTEMLLDSKFKTQALKDIQVANDVLKIKPVDNDAENISRAVAARTETGRLFVKKVLERKYDALVDTHGTNVADIPIIVLNAESNLSAVGNLEWTQPVKDYARSHYGFSV